MDVIEFRKSLPGIQLFRGGAMIQFLVTVPPTGDIDPDKVLADLKQTATRWFDACERRLADSTKTERARSSASKQGSLFDAENQDQDQPSDPSGGGDT